MNICSAARRSAAPLLLAASTLAWAGATAADAMRCGTELVTEGDTQIEVLEVCGEPTTIEKFPAQLVPGLTFYGQGYYVGPYASPLIPVSVEVWTYNFGPRRLIRQVRLQGGHVAEIRTLGYGF